MSSYPIRFPGNRGISPGSIFSLATPNADLASGRMVKTADTSAVVAAFASWHENHEAARRALDGGLNLIAHCALESYSVLTCLPPPHRASGTVVREYLEARFPEPFLRLSERAYRCDRCARRM